MKVKIVQWNIFYKEKLSKVVRELKKINSDIICLQEVRVNSKYNPGIDGAKYIAEKLKLNYFFAESHYFENDEVQGNIVLSKFPIKRRRIVKIQRYNPKKTDSSEHEGRSYLEVGLKVGSGNLIVATTHLSFVADHVQTEKRKKESNKLLSLIKSHKNNFVFAGDLNAFPESALVNSVLKFLKNVGPDLKIPSAGAKKYSESNLVKKNDIRIDYIFGSKDIQFKGARVLKTKVSDHYPIVAVFDMLDA